MTSLQFLASIVNSLAWPGALISIVLLLKQPITSVLGELKQFKFKEFEAQFGRNLEHAEARAEEVIAAVGEVDGPAHSNEVQSKEVGRRNERFMQLLDISPSAAVVDAWIDIEELLRDASSTGNPSSKIVSTIQLTEKLPPHLKRLIVELRHIRNTVAHADAEISRSAASRFGDLAEIAMVQLQLMTTKKEG